MPTWFEATAEEQGDVLALIAAIKAQLDADKSPDGYNVGFNAGPAAGQTVMHLHVHVIPRYAGDMVDPRGGVRGVIPSKQKYGDAPPPGGALPVFVPGEDTELGPVLAASLAKADHARLLSAFVQPSGLQVLAEDIVDALERGATVRVLTGDYMHITSADALRSLWEWTREYECFDARLYQCPSKSSFHAKAYIFESADRSVAYVGSSNLSRTALTHGVEWNLRTHPASAGPGFVEAREHFDRLFASGRSAKITRELIEEYAKVSRIPASPEPRAPRPVPHEVQREALTALSATRTEGARRGMVVLATGLGKTYLSAFDFERTGGRRALFVAHREEILGHALTSWQRIFPERYVGLFVGGQSDREADILFASVQKLARAKTLKSFDPEDFDYIVIDEFHHAAASTYRKVLAHFRPRFLLGLTATPDRMDGASLLGLCDDNLVYRAGLVRGISSELLVPFHYYGVADTVDFEPIPWRSGRFDADALAQAVETRERAEQALAEYKKRSPEAARRTIAFCCSVTHADYMAEFFRGRGIAAVAVHSGPSSAPRAESLRDFAAGKLEIMCAVDLFNEGLDVPDINVVLMLRPTASPVIFLQQLGRGLRLGRTIEKPHLTVVDFIGNHRAFLQKAQGLAALTGSDLPVAAIPRALANKEVPLPPGCSVDIEMEAVEMLEKVARASRDDMLVYEYMTLRDSHGRRPTAGEVFASGVHLKPVHDRYGTWFDFVEAQGDLSDDERRVLERHRAWFKDIGKRSRMTKSFKMLALAGLLELDGLRTGLGIVPLAHACRSLLRRDPALHVEAPKEAAEGASLGEFVTAWRKFPLEVWAAGKSDSQKWFTLSDTAFTPRFAVEDEDADVFDEMTRELVDVRLREHRSNLAKRGHISNHGAPIPLRVSHSSGRPILRLDRERYPELPEADHEVRVQVDDDAYLLRFKKVAVNVALEVAGGVNVLPTLMRKWFGPKAGHPGSRHYVELVLVDRGWRLRPQDPELSDAGAIILPFPERPFYGDLMVACGRRGDQAEDADNATRIRVDTKATVDPERTFVVRATGDSMDGGEAPIHDGDLVLCEWADATRAEDYEGKACLLSGYEGPSHSFAQIKVPTRRDGRWVLRSWNPEHADQAVDPGVTLQIAARVVEVVAEPTGVTLWGNYERKDVVTLFGQHYGPSWRVGHRNFDVNGEPNTFLFVTLRKPPSTKPEHRYADRFLSQTEFQWESQASTVPKGKKGQSIIAHKAQKRLIHLFVRPEEKVEFVYCGLVDYVRHTGSKPMRVRFRMQNTLPRELYRRWTG